MALSASRAEPDVLAMKLRIHPFPVRLAHWVNVLAVAIMVFSGWRIYDASPLFSFHFPLRFTLGGWLAGALLWHFAAMWLLVANGLFYVTYGILSGHYRKNLFPIDFPGVIHTALAALRGRLAHGIGVYNPLQRLAYVGVILLLALIVLSGLAIWKPVQFQWLSGLMGDYEGARRVHFFAMAGIVLFVLIHVAMVMLVPRTFLPMWTGYIRRREVQP